MKIKYRYLVGTLLLHSFLAPFCAHGALIAKENNALDLDSGASWTGGVVPGATDIALWEAISGTNPASIGTGLNLQGIQIHVAGTNTISSGTGSLTLGTSGIDIATGDFIIQSPVNTVVDQNWNIATGHSLRIEGRSSTLDSSGNITVSGGGELIVGYGATVNASWSINSNTVTVDSPTNLAVGMVITPSTIDGIPGGTTITAINGNIVTLSNNTTTNQMVNTNINFAAIGSHTGTITINGGVVRQATRAPFAGMGVWGPSGSLILGQGTVISGVGTNQTFGFGKANTILAGDIQVGDALNTGLISLDGTIDLANGSRTITVANGTTGNQGSKLTFVSFLAPSVIQNGTLVLTSSAPSGIAQVNIQGSAFAGNTALIINSNVSVYSSASIFFGSSIPSNTPTLTINAGGELNLGGANFRSSAQVASLSGTGQVTSSATGVVADLLYSVLTVNGTAAQSSTFGGVISEGSSINGVNGAPGIVGLTKNNLSTLTLTGTNNYTGATRILGGTLKVGNGGITGSLAGTGVVEIGAGATLEINRSGTYTASHNLIGTGNLNIAGSGTVTLQGAQNFIGTTTVSAGTLLIGNATQIASIVLSGNLNNGSLIITLPSTAGLVAGQSVTGTNIPAGAFIVKVLNGTQVILSAGATGTTVGVDLNFGALGNLALGNGMGSGNVVVAQGATLGGSSIIGGNVTVEGNLLGGDGTSTDTLSLATDLTLGSNSTITLSLGSIPASHSTIARTGFGTWTFDTDQRFTFLDQGWVPGTTYTGIITGLAEDPGSLANWTTTNGFIGTFTYDGASGINYIFTAVPEPGTLTFVAIGIVLLISVVTKLRDPTA